MLFVSNDLRQFLGLLAWKLMRANDDIQITHWFGHLQMSNRPKGRATAVHVRIERETSVAIREGVEDAISRRRVYLAC
jgi:hypothetical protein